MKIYGYINESKKMVKKDDIMVANRRMVNKLHLEEIAAKDEQLRKERRQEKRRKLKGSDYKSSVTETSKSEDESDVLDD